MIPYDNNDDGFFNPSRNHLPTPLQPKRFHTRICVLVVVTLYD